MVAAGGPQPDQRAWLTGRRRGSGAGLAAHGGPGLAGLAPGGGPHALALGEAGRAQLHAADAGHIGQAGLAACGELEGL